MPAFLKYIDMENFKSYRGHHRIGPLKSFTAVVGPSGSGTLNFMDAVSFAMGEKTPLLRVKHLSDLIHGASITRPVGNSASVIATFVLQDMNEKQFQRSVTGQSSDYKIDGQSVSVTEYQTELQNLGINVKEKNFLVFQGAVENLAKKSPKQRTAFIEEITGSALKQKYEECRIKVHRCEEEAQFFHLKKKCLAAERSLAKLEEQEYCENSRLRKELKEQEKVLQMFHLYHSERNLRMHERELVLKQRELAELERKQQEAEDALEKNKTEAGVAHRELAKLEQEICEVEDEISKKQLLFMAAKERGTHAQKKLESALRMLEQVRRSHLSHQAEVRKLEEELRKIKELKAAQTALGASQAGRDETRMEEAQILDYQQLKIAIARQTAPYLMELDSVKREQEADRYCLENELRLKAEFEIMHRQKVHEKNEVMNRLEMLLGRIRIYEEALEEQRQMRDELQTDECRGRAMQLQQRLEELTAQLDDSRFYRHEEARRSMKFDVIDTLKLEIPGVYGRIIDMIKSTHTRYHVAIAKVVGEYVGAIVVDTETTAHRCIRLLNKRRLEPETFYPLDCIQAKPLENRLRDIHEPRNVKLLFDVLLFEPAAIHRAVLFITNNALVCETPEDAFSVACKLDGRYDVVALNGTFYRKSGIISGGPWDLSKVKRWDEKHYLQLKVEKEELTEELREIKKKLRKESELATVQMQIRSSEYWLKYFITDRERTLEQIEDLNPEIAELKRKIDNVELQMEVIEHRIRTRVDKIEQIEKNIKDVEEALFRVFCRNTSLVNIWQHQECELHAQQERLMKLDTQIDHINTTLQFERSCDTRNNLMRCEREVRVRQARDELGSALQAEAERQQDVDREEQRGDALKADHAAARARRNRADEQVHKARKKLTSRDWKIRNVQKQIAIIEAQIERKRSDCHNILMRCKNDNIIIPLQGGSLDDIVDTEFDPSRIQVDYSSLSESLKVLAEPDEIEYKADRLQKAMNSLQNIVDRIGPLNMEAGRKLNGVCQKLCEAKSEFKKACERVQKAKLDFERVKKERRDKFLDCFQHVESEIDRTYKALAMNQSAQAILYKNNSEEPYLGGIDYYCGEPGKPLQPVSNLSGGEKTVAALALLFAVYSYLPAPFFLLDEIDAALDNTNIANVASYIRSKKGSLQTIAISFKEEFYGCADFLIGISSQPANCIVSDVLMHNLEDYDDDD